MVSNLILVGFLFLINPDFYTLDFLPDIIGYLLIFGGLKKLSFLDERIASARRLLVYLALVSALKLISVPAVIGTTVENTRLTFCFIFFVVELALGYFTANNILKGVQYLAIRKDADLALKGFDTAKFFMTLFVFTKHIGSFLMPAAAIFFPNVDADPDVADTSRQLFLTVRNVLFVIGVVSVLLVGIYAARVLKAYLSRCREDRVFIENLKASYDEKVTCNLPLLTTLSVKSAFLCFFVSFVFLADLYLDDVSFIPTFFFPLFVFLGLRFFGKYHEIPLWWSVSSVASALLSAISYGYRLAILLTMENKADFPVRFVTDAPGLILGILTRLSFVLTAICMILAVFRVARKYTEFRYRNYAVVLVLFVVMLVGMGFYQYRFPSTFAVLPSTQWVLWAVSLYLHKKSLDEIFEETEYHLM